MLDDLHKLIEEYNEANDKFFEHLASRRRTMGLVQQANESNLEEDSNWVGLSQYIVIEWHTSDCWQSQGTGRRILQGLR